MPNVRLKDFPTKASPTGSDIFYMGDAADSDTEKQTTLQEMINAFPALASIGGLTVASGKILYTTAENDFDQATITAFGLDLIDSADAAAARTSLELATVVARSVVTYDENSDQIAVALTDGQIIIGSTAGSPAGANITAGSGISIANGSNTITISGTGSGIGWNEVTTTSAAMAADSGYITNNAGLVTLTLPTTAALGTALTVIGKGAGGWSIAQNASQVIQVGSVGSTAGVGGSVSSTNRYDSIELICTTANTVWTATGAPQSAGLTIV